jgi:hypothetical protein
MVFQLRPYDTREHQYPNAQDLDFLGYDRPSDRWKVDASGIKLYASGISVELDKDDDSVSVWSASGTPATEVWVNDEIAIYSADPLDGILVKKRITYNLLGDPIQVKEATIATPSGQPCVVKTITYNDINEPEYVIENYGTW